MEQQPDKQRETFTSHFGLLMTMIGVAVGLGNVWRFPYMAWEFGGSAFIFLYLLAVLLIGIPALMCEWALGRHTRRGPLGAFARSGLPGGKYAGYLIFCVVMVAVGYYSALVGWVGYFALGQLMNIVGNETFEASNILFPEQGFQAKSFFLQLMMTTIVVLGGGTVIAFGLKKGIERASKIIMPTLFVILIVLVVRSLTLPGAGAGLKWCFGSFRINEIANSSTVAAAMGQAIFSMSIGGSFMVIYGSYLDKKSLIPKNAIFTGLGDTAAALLAALAIIPATFALNPELTAGAAEEFSQAIGGPGLIFSTLPATFQKMPAGSFFGLLFFLGLFGAAFLSAIAALEVIVGGLVDNTSLTRKKAIVIVCAIVLVISLPPTINEKIFVPWDLTFGSGMQVVGTLLAVLACVWCVKRSEMLAELSAGGKPFPVWLYWWMRLVIPAIIIMTGVLWFSDNALPYLKGVFASS